MKTLEMNKKQSGIMILGWTACILLLILCVWTGFMRNGPWLNSQISFTLLTGLLVLTLCLTAVQQYLLFSSRKTACMSGRQNPECNALLCNCPGRATHITQTLLDIANAVTSSDNLDALYAHIHTTLGRLIDVTNFYIALYNKEERSVMFPYYRDEVDDEFPDIKNFTETGSLTGEVILARHPLFLDAEALLQRKEAGSLQGSVSKVWMGAPLIINNDVVGVVAAQSYTDPHLYQPSDVHLLASVSGQIAIAIQRKQAEDALKESEARFKNLFNLSPQAVILVELQSGVIVDANRELYRKSGLTPELVINKTTTELGFWSYNDRKAFVDELEACGEVKGKEVKIRLLDGQEKYLAMAAKIVRISGKKIILNVLLDITEQKKADLEKQALQQQLAQAEKMKALGALAGGVAHDLNNILSGIVSYPDLLLMKLPSESDLIKPIKTIRKAGQRAAAVVSDLLIMAKGGTFKQAPLDINKAVTECLASDDWLAFSMNHPDAVVRTEFSDPLAPVTSSPLQIRKLIMNIICYSIETASGSDTVDVSTRNQYVDHSISRQKINKPFHSVVLSVFNTGTVIQPEDLKHLFDPFYTKKVMGQGGTGLELSVIWNITQDHDGFVDVCSNEEGTRFDIYLPASAPLYS